ncbi:hypothetical protein ABH926_001513 [Catenulispora sp. GP43]|uniref:hypothetical protein n=1 Tax=Catenulispora sp. GP43 TaxID=3156263 RepID=UPI0035164233
MPSSASSRFRLPKTVAFGGLALTAVSAGSLVGLPGVAQAASPAVAGAVNSVATNTEESALGHNRYFTYMNRQSPDLAGAR